ncbi:hypothetical protein KR054_000816, partial [Drosophila jambulina]
ENTKQITSTVEFTNIKCNTLDPNFAEFEYCYLKSVNRTYKYLSLKVNLYKLPITKVKANVELLKRFSGYKPFLYNVTVDVCQFMKNPKSNPIAAYLYGFFKNHSNMNHTCPYNVSLKSVVVLIFKIYLVYLQHDIIIDRLSVSFLNQHVTEVLPFPIGDYLFQSNWIADGINRANVNLYFTLS